MNPYWGANFFDFFVTLFKRISGLLPLSTLPSDEVQLLTLLAISISTGILGVFLTLRKMTMLANSLSHTTLLGIILCYLFFLKSASHLELNIPLLIASSIFSALLTATLTEGVRKYFNLQEDAAIGLVFTTLFGLGVLLVTLYTRSMHIGVELITGNVDALNASDLSQAFLVTGLNIGALILSFRPWTLSAFDPQLARTSGIHTKLYHYLLMALTSLTLVVSIRAIGVLLVLAFLVGPTLIARHYCYRIIPLLLVTIGIGILFSLVGVALSRHLLSTLQIPLSTGGLIVTLMSVGYFFSALIKQRSHRVS